MSLYSPAHLKMSTIMKYKSNKHKGSPKKRDSPKQMRHDRGYAIRYGMEDVEDDKAPAATLLSRKVNEDPFNVEYVSDIYFIDHGT